jgi:hypothetical protein
MTLSVTETKKSGITEWLTDNELKEDIEGSGRDRI